MSPYSSCTVLFASETGNARECAFVLSRTLSHSLACGVAPYALSDDAFTLSSLGLASAGGQRRSLVILCVSTCGQGEIPRHARAFWTRLLHKAWTMGEACATVDMAVFGLGDSSYPGFNVAAKKMRRRLLQLGAKEITPPVMADERAVGGFESALVDTFLPALTDVLKPSSSSTAATTAADGKLVNLGALPYQLEPCPGNDDDVVMNDDDLTTAEAQMEARRAAYLVELAERACVGMEAPVPPRGFVKTNQDGAQEPSAFDPRVATLVACAPLTADGYDRPVLSVSLSTTAETSGEAAASVELHRSNSMAAACLAARAAANVPLTFEAGDSIAIVPTQPDGAARRFLAALQVSPHLRVRVVPTALDVGNDGAAADACAAPVRAIDLINGAVDCHGGEPRRAWYEALLEAGTRAKVAGAEDESLERELDTLRHFLSRDGVSARREYGSDEGRTCVEVLEEFKACARNLSLDRAVACAPRLRPRLFSAASAPDLASGRVELCVAIHTWGTPFGRKRTGLCSRYISHATIGSKVLCWRECGDLVLPEMNSASSPPPPPVVLVGPGTGVAPFRAMVQSRLARAASPSSDMVASAPGGSSRCVVFLGNRHVTKDFLYGDEWIALARSGRADVHACFSRSPCAPGEASAFLGGSIARRCNTALRDQGALVWDALSTHLGSCFVCGSASTGMTRDVGEALVRVAMEHGGMSDEEARKWLRTLELARRFVVEAY